MCGVFYYKILKAGRSSLIPRPHPLTRRGYGDNWLSTVSYSLKPIRL